MDINFTFLIDRHRISFPHEAMRYDEQPRTAGTMRNEMMISY